MAKVVQQINERRLLADDALTRLAEEEDRQAAQVVEMHHFCGLSHETVAVSLGPIVYRVRQKWTYPQPWLRNDPRI